jgi:hypothetical protein
VTRFFTLGFKEVVEAADIQVFDQYLAAVTSSLLVPIHPSFHDAMDCRIRPCTLTQRVATGGVVTNSTSSGGSASVSSTDNMRPLDMTSVASGLVTDAVHTRMHDTHALSGAAPASLQGTASPPDASQCLLADFTVSPEVLTRVALQARLQASISLCELERERDRAKALEDLVNQLVTELGIARQAVTRLAGVDRR